MVRVVYGMVMMLLYGMMLEWHGMVWYGMVWCYDVSVWNLGSVWYGYDVSMVWYDVSGMAMILWCKCYAFMMLVLWC